MPQEARPSFTSACCPWQKVKRQASWHVPMATLGTGFGYLCSELFWSHSSRGLVSAGLCFRWS